MKPGNDQEAVARMVTGEIEENIEQLCKLWSYERVEHYIHHLASKNLARKVLAPQSEKVEKRGKYKRF